MAKVPKNLYWFVQKHRKEKEINVLRSNTYCNGTCIYGWD